MISFGYLPIFLYFLLEFFRRNPIKEEKQNRGSSILIGAILTWMVIIPSLIYFFTNKKVNSLLYIGIIIGLLGVWLRYSSMKTIGRFYSRNVGVQGEHSIVENGPYRYIRHPGYLGTFLTYLGFAISTSSFTAVGINIVLFFVAYSYRINIEEQTLVSKFGEKYRQYQRKSWRLIPFIY